MKVLVVISSNDAETAWNAFRFAVTSLIYENEVTVFLIGKGVEAISVSTLQYDINEQIELFKHNGGNMIGCGVCCETRKDEMPFLEDSLNCDLGSMQQLYELSATADKVLSF